MYILYFLEWQAIFGNWNKSEKSNAAFDIIGILALFWKVFIEKRELIRSRIT